MLEDLLVKAVKKYPEHTAIVYDNLRISYDELYRKITGLSKGLSALGIGQGGAAAPAKRDRVALILPNCPEFVFSFFAIAKLKAIAVPLNHLFKAEEISYYVSDSNVKAIVTDGKRAKMCREIILERGQPIELIVVDEEQSSATYFYDLITPIESPSNESSTTFTGEVIYQYSSGSTGRPKRVGRTQENLYHEVTNFTETARVTSSDRILCLVPLYHAHGLGNCLLAALCNGATLVILEQVWQRGMPVEIPFVFRRTRVLELIEQEQITILPAVPYIFNTLAETPPETPADLSTLRLCFSAGNFLSKDIFDKFRDRFGVSVRQLYGCTEAGSVSINLDEQPEKTWNCVGVPMKNVEIKIIDDGDKELPNGTSGEVAIASQALTNGYHDLPELNQQAFRDGMFFTGDLGKIDEEGRLYITGRKKILIDTGGRKVDPIEIEDVLIGHPKVKEAVVVGVKGPFAGEIVKAVIVLKNAQDCQEQEITAYCKERLAEFKVPKIIEFRDEIPKSPLGKILRKALV
ncbi:acyl--CoA ligase [Pleurocapsales cyanobacterium LEGE 06147]|nr:acyl--CoA ligase [Pleurocapsales cyanobacterium LEGE 06147]